MESNLEVEYLAILYDNRFKEEEYKYFEDEESAIDYVKKAEDEDENIVGAVRIVDGDFVWESEREIG